MKMTRNMRKRIRSLTRKQLLAYVFLVAKDGVCRGALCALNAFEIGNIIIAWGHDSDPRDFHIRIRKAKALAKEDDERFREFCLENTS